MSSRAIALPTEFLNIVSAFASTPTRDFVVAPRPTQTSEWFRLGVFALSISTGLLCYIGTGLMQQQQTIRLAARAQQTSIEDLAISIGTQNSRLTTLTKSIQDLAVLVDASSRRVDSVQTRMDESDRDLHRLQSRLQRVETVAFKNR
jgi:peptidoglycan hydrolase CwlO-like protein